MNLNHCNIHHKGEITNWDEALPLGNGKLGVLLYGSNPLRLSLDRMDLWDNRPAPATLEEGFHFSHMKQLIDSGSDKDWREFLRMFDHIYTATAFPSKITAGRLELTFADPFTPEYTLSLDNAAAVVTDQNGSLRLTGFTSAEDFIGVFRVYGDYSMSVHIPKYISDHDAAGPGTSMGYPPTQIVQENGFTYTRQETHTDFTYGIVVYEKNCGSCRELYFTITASTDGENDLDDAKASLLRAADTGYEALLEKHTAWWQSYWAKSEINIGDPMVEPVYYRSMYLFGSCSRKGFYPMPLQGVWTADNDALPPWKGDYHHDTNTQLSYQAYLKANHLPEGEVFLDYLWNLRDAYRKYARDFFSVDGLLIPGVSTMDGKPMGGWPQYTYSPAMTIWTIQSFDEYYLYTDDIEFLKNRAYPMFTEVGTAIEGLLEERGGKLYLPLSSSPEIYDNQRKAYLKPNSNFDLALMRYLFTTLAGYAKILNDDNAAAHWNRILSKLDDIALNGSSILLAEGEPLHVSHRHLSHLMCLYPLHLINYDTPEHMAIYQRALHDLERLGTGYWVGFSFGMAAQIYAMALNGNGAYRNLYTYAHAFTADNGFNLNGDYKNYGYSIFHYRPFTLEAAYGFCDALHEMLMQDHMGYIHVFPAIPNEWQNREISFTDLRSRGGVLVSAVRCGDSVREIRLKCDTARTVRIRSPFAEKVVTITAGEERYTAEAADRFLTVHVPAAAAVLITAD